MSVINPAVEAFLETKPTVVLSTIRRDGSPQILPLWYLWDGEAFIISTATETAKWHNLRRDPRVALCVDDAEGGRMVVAYGRALPVDDGIWQLTRRLAEKYIHDRDAVQAHMERIFTNWTRVILKVGPDRIITRNLD